MRVTLLYAAATRPSALPDVRVCDTARKKIVSRKFGTGSKFFNDFSRARTRACARRRVHMGVASANAIPGICRRVHGISSDDSLA